MSNVSTIPYLNTNADLSSANTKSYTDKSLGFDDIFESVNKTFNNSDKQPIENKKQDYKPEDKKPEENKSVENKSKEETNASADKPKIKDEQTQEKKVEDKQEDSQNKQSSDNKEKVSDENKTESGTVEVANQNQPALNASEVLASIQNPAEKLLCEISEKLMQLQPQAVVQNVLKTPDLTTEVPKAIQAAKDLLANKVQPQTQQVLLNLQPQEQVQTPVVEQSNSQAPLIQVNNDVIEKAAKLEKTPLKQALEQTKISQEILDATNAKVVNVEVTSNSDNLLSKQNAQEQGVKVAIESISNQPATSVQQTNFEKAVDNIQQPKEISKTDILSQIHTKLEQMKDDTTTKVTIVLKPENLGKVSLELINGKEGLTARMTTENAQVKEILDKSLESLKNSLGSQGLNVNSVTVKVEETPQAQSNDMFLFDQKEFAQGNQQFPNGSKGESAENKTFEMEEYKNLALAEEGEESEKVSSHNGQVDYKI